MENNLKIEKELEGEKLTVRLNGDLNVLTLPKLQEETNKSLGGVKELIFDLAEVEYISSSGLRVLLSMESKMRRENGKMILKSVNSSVKEIIRLTGLTKELNFED